MKQPADTTLQSNTLTTIFATRSGKRYSPLRYPGGKGTLGHLLFDLIDENDLGDCIYVEPFAGGCGSALHLLFLEKVDSIVINDYDNDIYHFWWAVLNETEQFIDKIHKVPLTVAQWRRQKAVLKNTDSGPFERGFATFYLNRTNHSGVVNASPIGGINQTGTWKMDARFNRQELAKRIERIGRYRSRIELSCRDGIELMKDALRRKDTLVYVDPPYYKNGSQLYLNYYVDADHQRLAKFLKQRRHKNWLLTYDDVPQIRALYEDFPQLSLRLNYSVKNARKGQELLVHSNTLTIPENHID